MKTVSPAPTIPIRHKNERCCQTASTSLSSREVDEIAQRMKALADPTRVRMLDILAQQAEPVCVCDLTPHFDQNQPTISHHLRLLREAGLIDTGKQGIWSYYWATNAGRSSLTAVRQLK